MPARRADRVESDAWLRYGCAHAAASSERENKQDK
jgi:hypothetical protein